MMNDVPRAPEERSLGELLGELTSEITTLVRQEATLAKTELGQKAARVGKDVGFLAAGGAVAYAGLLAIIASIIAMLAHVMPWWAAALLVGVVVASVGAFLVTRGLAALKREDLTPHATLESLAGERRASDGRTSNRRAAV